MACQESWERLRVLLPLVRQPPKRIKTGESGCANKRKPCSQGWTKAAARFERKNNIAVCAPDAFQGEVGFLGWRDCGFCGDASCRVVFPMKKGLLSGQQSVSTILDA